MKFLWRLLLFFLPLIIAFLCIEYKLSHISNSFTQKQDGISAHQHAQILVLGNSQAYNGIDPQYFSVAAYNLANNSQTLYYDKAMLQKAIAAMPDLKVVIITTSDYSFFMRLEDGIESWRKYFYRYHFGVSYDHYNISDLRNYSLMANYGPVKSLKMIWNGIRTVNEDTVLANGYRRSERRLDTSIDEVQRGKELVSYESDLLKKGSYEQGIECFDSMLSVLRRYRLEPMIVGMPVTGAYLKYGLKEVREKNAAIIQSMCKKYNCTYHDYLDDVRFTAVDFADENHLNVTGAAKFSMILQQEVLTEKNVAR